ncbi:MAG TPA: TIR domain-containing protein [Pirellulaceae bacterium]|jgi:WD40 repeat protein|nr:TIR domain-containing protein [Pirellulaceae bacterium]
MVDLVRYDNFAFISYSRTDVRIAARLQSDLERFSLPADVSVDRSVLWKSKRLRPIFRDHTDLDVRNDPFWRQLDAHIRKSRYLILLCSPASATSVYVNREVELFLASHDDDLDMVLPIVVRGGVTATEGSELCLPACLKPYRDRLIERNLPQVSDSTRFELLLKTASWLLRVKYDTLYARHRRREKRRRLATIAAAAAIGFVLFASVGVTLWSRSAAASARADAAASDAAKKESDAAKEVSDDRARGKGYQSQIRLAFQSILQNELETARGALAKCDPDLRDWEWRFLHAQIDQSLASFDTTLGFEPVGLSANGKRLAICGPGESFRIVDPNDLQEVRQIETPGHLPTVIACSPTGDAIATGADDGRVSIWNANSGELVASRPGYEGAMIRISFDPAGARVYASNEGAVVAVDASSGKLIGEAMSTVDMAGRFVLNADGSRLAALDFDGHRLVVFETDGTRLLWELRREHPTLFHDVAFDTSGRRLVLATSGEGAKILDVESGDPVAAVGSPSADVRVVRSNRGMEIALGTYDGDVQTHTYSPISDIVRELRNWNLYETEVSALGFADAEGMLLTSSLDGVVHGRRWVFPDSSTVRFRGHEGRVRRILPIQPQPGRTKQEASFVTWADDGTARVWSLMRRAAPIGKRQIDQFSELRAGRLSAPPVPVRYSRDRRFAVGVGPDLPAGAIAVGGNASVRTIARVHDAATGDEIGVLAHDGFVTCAAFLADGARIVTASDDGSVRLWSAADASLVRTFDEGNSPIRSLAAFPDGQSIGTGSESGEIRLRNMATGEASKKLPSGDSTVLTLAVSGDGERLASGDEAGTLRIVDLRTGSSAEVRSVPAKAVVHAAFSPDGLSILTISRDGEAAIRDAAKGQVKHRLGSGAVADAAWNADGTRALALTAEGSLQIWDAEQDDRILEIPLEIGRGYTLQFLADLDEAVLCGEYGSVTLYGR